MQEKIVIVGAARTAVGSFLGSLSTLQAYDLGAHVIAQALQRSGVGALSVDEVIMGQVLCAGNGQNPARIAAMKAGIEHSKTALTINQVCGSGLRAVALGLQSILTGNANIVVAGGQESMSLAPHVAPLRMGQKMGDLTFIDTMIKDGLWDAFHDYHMGVTAENVAQKFSISRQEQDEFALNSQLKAQKASEGGLFDEEIAPITLKSKKGDVVFAKDEYIRLGATIDALSALRPAFSKEGTVTAGNASGLNDGAAVVVLMKKSEAEKRGLPILAEIVSWATCGVAPDIMGTGPIPASREALARAGWTVSDLDVIEANEAFAAQALAVNREMGWDRSKVNVNGGAIALGHPIGASGARILVTLLHEMKRRGSARGLATLCIGGGMGIAMCLKR